MIRFSPKPRLEGSKQLLTHPLVSSMIPPSGVDAAAALLKLASLMPRVHMRLQVGNLILELQELLALLVGAKRALDSLRGAAPAHLLCKSIRTHTHTTAPSKATYWILKYIKSTAYWASVLYVHGL